LNPRSYLKAELATSHLHAADLRAKVALFLGKGSREHATPGSI